MQMYHVHVYDFRKRMREVGAGYTNGNDIDRTDKRQFLVIEKRFRNLS